MNYTGSGLKILIGCAIVKTNFNYETKYNVGDKLYLRSQALKGKYEKVFIKKVNLRYYSLNNFYNIIQYFDTFNAFHDERELLTFAQAKVLVDAYIARKNAEYLDLIKNC
jgi:hypothetical protein